MSQDIVDFAGELAAASPEVAALYEEHLAYYGQLLPHVLMGDVTRAVVAVADDGRCPEWLIHLLGQLEDALMTRSQGVAVLVGVSFIENLCGEQKALATLRPRMGLALRRELKSICGV